MTDHYQGGFTP